MSVFFVSRGLKHIIKKCDIVDHILKFCLINCIAREDIVVEWGRVESGNIKAERGGEGSTK